MFPLPGSTGQSSGGSRGIAGYRKTGPGRRRRPYRRTGAGVPAPPTAQHRTHRAGRRASGRQRDLELADRAAAGGVDEPRRRVEDLRRRRRRVCRHARRIRRVHRRPRTPGDRRRGQRTGAPRNTLRSTHRRRDLERPRTGAPLRPAAVALRELGNRSHHGRRTFGPGGDRTRQNHQSRRLLPRPPRLGPGVSPAGSRRGRPPRPSHRCSRQQWNPLRNNGSGRDRSVQ